jgi:hypothetical protein
LTIWLDRQALLRKQFREFQYLVLLCRTDAEDEGAQFGVWSLSA